jgi:hypothetical protein
VAKVSEQPDPERLLAEALRAQAVRAPLPQPEPGTTDSRLGLVSESPYGLLSGQHSYRIERPTSVAPRYADQPPVRRRPLPVVWIVLLAILLGLAAGAVTGLVSLL